MNTKTLKRLPLFSGMTETELAEALTVLRAEERSYQKEEILLHAGSVTERMGIVLSGSVSIESSDVWGNRTILSHVGVGGMFAETYALLSGEPMLVDVVANEDCRVLFLRSGSLQTLRSRGGGWIMQFMANLLMISAHKNLTLSSRSFHTAPKSVRGRVMSYLNARMLRKGSNEFDIPFDRQQLADYLNVERTALSKELGRMRRDGLIDFRKNHFVLKES